MSCAGFIEWDGGLLSGGGTKFKSYSQQTVNIISCFVDFYQILWYNVYWNILIIIREKKSTFEKGFVLGYIRGHIKSGCHLSLPTEATALINLN